MPQFDNVAIKERLFVLFQFAIILFVYLASDGIRKDIMPAIWIDGLPDG